MALAAWAVMHSVSTEDLDLACLGRDKFCVALIVKSLFMYIRCRVGLHRAVLNKRPTNMKWVSCVVFRLSSFRTVSMFLFMFRKQTSGMIKSGF